MKGTTQPYAAQRHYRSRTNIPKFNRFYSSPLNDSPDSTPLKVYGLEQREPSIIEKRRSRAFQRMSFAFDDIREDFTSGQLNPRETAEKLKRRTSTITQDGSPSASMPATSVPLRSRQMSILSLDAWSSPPQRLRRRLTSLSSFPRLKLHKPRRTSISQPNLIGTSTQL